MPVIPTRASAAVPIPNLVILPKTISISIYKEQTHNEPKYIRVGVSLGAGHFW